MQHAPHNMMENIQLDIHHKILGVLLLIAYLAAMLIQIRDPKTDVHLTDWILALLCSLLGATITYFVVMKWANIGWRMAITVIVSLVSYRTLKFIVSNEAQDEFARGFWTGIMNALKRLFNADHKPPSNNDNGNN